MTGRDVDEEPPRGELPTHESLNMVAQEVNVFLLNEGRRFHRAPRSD
jgi:hypothetical protein